MRIRARRKIAMVLSVSAVLLLSVLPIIDVPEEVSAETHDGPDLRGDEDEWHSFHKDLRNTGSANCNGPMTDDISWVRTFPGWSAGSISYANGIIFHPAGPNGVQAIDAFTGDLIWNFTHDAGRVVTMPVYYDGKVYFGTNWGSGTFYALYASNGSVFWTQAIGDEYIAAPVITDGIVYAPLISDRVVAMNAANGSVVSDWYVLSGMHVTPAYEPGILYTGNMDMQAVNATSGDIIWEGSMSRIRSSVVLVGDKVCGHNNGYVICLNKTNGAQAWKRTVGTINSWNAIESTPAVLGDRLFVGTQDGWLYALDVNNGSIVWELKNGNLSGKSFIASPVTALNGVVYFASDYLYAIEATTGDVIWSIGGFCPAITRASPALVDGVLYAPCSETGQVWAVGNATPSPPAMLDARLDGPSAGDVVLIWQRSFDDGGGMNDVTHYDIYRSTSLEGPYSNVANVNASGLEMYEWVCTGCGEGDPSDYFFYVSANDSVLAAASAYKVSKFTHLLAKGANLLSIPLIQSDESIMTVFQTVKYDKAWFYDSSSQEWKWYMKHKGYRRGLWNTNHTMGLWVNVTSDSNLTVAGIVPAQTTIHLYEGWNLVSFPSFNDSYTVADLKAETGVTRLEGYDSMPPHHLRVLGDGDVLLAGEAYWARVETDLDWIVEVS